MLNDVVTPEDYLLIEMRLDATRLFLDELEKESFDRALASPPPVHLRPATPADVVVNAVLWYPRHDFGTLQTWRIVREVRDPQDAWKAYIADDGCRYGLDGAFVRAELEAEPSMTTLRTAVVAAIANLRDPGHRHGCTGIPSGVDTQWVEVVIARLEGALG